MERFSQSQIIKKLNKEEISLFTISDFKKIFGIKKLNTTYKIIERLTKKEIIKKLSKGKYLYLLLNPDDYQIANFIYSPSYISLESALSFYGIISQFPYQITSVTLKKSKKFSPQAQWSQAALNGYAQGGQTLLNRKFPISSFYFLDCQVN